MQNWTVLSVPAFKQTAGIIEYRILPKKGKVNNHLLGFENQIILNRNNSLNEILNRLRYVINFKNRSELRLNLDRQDTRLLYLQNLLKTHHCHRQNMYIANVTRG